MRVNEKKLDKTAVSRHLIQYEIIPSDEQA